MKQYPAGEQIPRRGRRNGSSTRAATGLLKRLDEAKATGQPLKKRRRPFTSERGRVRTFDYL